MLPMLCVLEHSLLLSQAEHPQSPGPEELALQPVEQLPVHEHDSPAIR